VANGDIATLDMNGMPWWVKAIVIVGVPSAISLGLVWSDRAHLSATVEANRSTLTEMRVTAAEHDRSMLQHFQVLAAQAAETNRILLAGCVNDAKTETARNRCLGR